MATNRNSTTFSSTYKDDWSKDDHYHRILFNNGRALQARELTQMQTIIQEEMASFGRNIFKEGSAISGGVPSINAQYRFVTLSGSPDLSTVQVGMIYTNGVQKARILEVDDANDKLFVGYVDNGGSAVSSFTQFINLDTISDQGGVGPNLTVSGNGSAVKFTIEEGEFFVSGHFVHSSQQSIILNASSPIANKTVGFKVEEKIITVDDDADLYDNAGDTVNNSSPGADRYQLLLTLTTEDQIAADESFVFVAKVENSTITEVVDLNDSYNQIEDMLAQRTYEESGNYVIKPFTLNFDEFNDQPDSDMSLMVSDGIAYVNGYRAEQQSPTKLIIPKPQETETVSEEGIAVSYGNYFIIDSITAMGADAGNLFGSNSGNKNHYKFSLTGPTGTCHLRFLEYRQGKIRAYVYGIKLASGNLADTTALVNSSLGITLSVEQNTQGITTLYESNNNNAFELLPRVRPATIGSPDTTIIRSLSTGALGSTSYSLPAVADGSYVNPDNWIVYNNTDNADETTTANINLTSNAISNLTSGKDYVVVFMVESTSSNNQERGKGLSSTTITTSLTIDENGTRYVPLGQYDIYSMDSVRFIDATGSIATPYFRLDNGQRDNYYTKGKLILDSDVNWNGNVYANFKYFTRTLSNNDKYYSVNSYPLSIGYSGIPSHKLADGTVLPLRNVLDYRPDFDEDLDSVVTSTVFPFPKNGTNVTADVSYYLPRADKVLITQEGDVQVLMGQQAQNPQFKKTPDNSLELYKIIFNANTIDENDLQVTPIEHKHYTMGDIAKIEEKLDRLADFTEFSLLELEAKLTPELDSDGVERAESGILVDDAQDQKLSDVSSPDYCASVDPDSKLFRPCFDEDNVRLIFDADKNPTANNVIRKGDLVMLNFDSASWISQPLASRSVNVNPTGKVDNIGCLMLSPSSDEWKNSKYDASYALPGASRIDVKQARLWNNWQWNWAGRVIENEHEDVGDDFIPSNRQYGAFGRKSLVERERYNSEREKRSSRLRTGRSVRRLISTDTFRERVGNRVVDLALIPWVRSRLIHFKAMGLKPNTKHTPYFDGVDVANLCRDEGSGGFVRWSTNKTEYGNKYDNLNSRPTDLGASSDLVSNSQGVIEGSFWLPSVRPTKPIPTLGVVAGEVSAGRRFRAGTREFKLIDASAQDIRTADSKAVAYYTVKGALPIKNQSVVSTRFGEFSYNVPNASLNVYNTYEIRDELDNIPSDNIRVEEPHLSGQWGAETSAIVPATVSNLSSVVSDYINVNQLLYGGTTNLPTVGPQKPLAQSFYVDNPFGATMVDVKLSFKSKDTVLPVSIHIRPVINGKPSETNIVPGSCVFKLPAEITTSSDASSETSFVFEEPVVLNAWTQYAIVVMTQSTEYDLWTAKTRDFVVNGSNNRIVYSRGTLGSMFLPQNGRLYKGEKDQDLKFTINRAKFTPKNATGTSTTSRIGGANGSVILRNANVPRKLLELNPFRVSNGSSEVYVKHPCHGFHPGDSCHITGANSSIGGLTVNGAQTVYRIDGEGFTFKPGGNASTDAVGGGENVLSDRNIQYNIIMPYVEQLVPNHTSTDISAKYTTGALITENSSSKYTTQVTTASNKYSRVTPGSNVSFNDRPRVIANPGIQATFDGGNGAYSGLVKVDLKSGNDYVSPIIDLQRCSLFLIENCVEDSDGRAFYPVPETSPNSGANGSRHITTPITVATEAVGFVLQNLYSTPSGTDYDMYYRTAQSGENIYNKPWRYLNPTDPLVKGERYQEAHFLGGGVAGNLNKFSQIQSKFVMHSSNSCFTPKISNFKWKFLAI